MYRKMHEQKIKENQSAVSFSYIYENSNKKKCLVYDKKNVLEFIIQFTTNNI